MYHFSTLALLALLSMFVSLTSCKKEGVFKKGQLTFSVDTLLFDTVFTTVGSVTKNFKFYNGSTSKLNIEEIELMGGQNSPFRLNVDGLAGNYLSDIEMLPKDSLFAFVDVKLDVNSQNYPLIIEDSIRFRANGKDHFVKLAVWGQDAYFHYNDWTHGIWPNDKPHVVYNRTYVDSNQTLTIQEGTKVHLHKNSIFFVYKADLKVLGTKDNKVVFEGDRLDAFYKDQSSQWYGIYFAETKNSEINHAIIKNGTAGIQLYGNSNLSPTPVLTIKNSEIYNHSNYGVFLYDGNNVLMENTLVHKNGAQAFLAVGKNEFLIRNCNLLGYGSGNTSSPALAIKNYYEDQTNTYVSSVTAKIYNTVIYGNLMTEMVFDTVNQNNMVNIQLDFQNNLIRKEQVITKPSFTNTLWNVNPLFVNIGQNDFKFPVNSPLKSAANAALAPALDFFENPRSSYDIGAIESN